MDRLTPAQLRAARAFLDWSMMDLASAARVSVSTVKRFERGSPQAVSLEAMRMMQDATEAAGVLFLPDDGNGLGGRLQPG